MHIVGVLFEPGGVVAVAKTNYLRAAMVYSMVRLIAITAMRIISCCVATTGDLEEADFFSVKTVNAYVYCSVVCCGFHIAVCMF